MNISKETKIGILALTSFVILYLGFNFLKGKDFFTQENKYVIIYKDIQGLTPANQVSLSGMKIGQVKEIELLKGDANKVKVVISIRKDLQLPEGTQAILASDGLLGGKLIRIEMGKFSGKFIEDGGMLVSTSETGVTDLLKEKALPLIQNLDSLTKSLRVVVKSFESTGMVVNGFVKNSDRSVSSLTASLNSTITENRSNLAGISANMRTLSNNLIETEKSLKPLIGKFNTMADSLNALKIGQAVATTQKSLEGLQKIMQGIEAGQGSMGKLLKDDSLYTNLNRSIADLDKLLIDFRLAPKRYVNISVFGGNKSTPPVVK
ncbi:MULTISPECIES: MlaD family protein [unclassified Arcicella]|uniref:MlaD family protein n=1 Tax=unclassified Arcicella TaxID=2644986 RepID=UPI00285D8AA7|nr:MULTISPECIES: MlaD family protein [unclassified Arcicella]MDR6560586.1 phospholipid/cholesterol/gamma-HCH transport system substrate-binding protein [Arcicella sp. BE51]MDR6814669.1 phospholipid/cholesterol/gamma-HCH transport system substrate-binding protein [Arcicella sp. BE140]MDR6826115.1 phospholipid/cholesterol/gamma-HCH transport system substrate-binding protein [Arcicella sp. BE139]